MLAVYALQVPEVEQEAEQQHHQRDVKEQDAPLEDATSCCSGAGLSPESPLQPAAANRAKQIRITAIIRM